MVTGNFGVCKKGLALAEVVDNPKSTFSKVLTNKNGKIFINDKEKGRREGSYIPDDAINMMRKVSWKVPLFAIKWYIDRTVRITLQQYSPSVLIVKDSTTKF